MRTIENISFRASEQWQTLLAVMAQEEVALLLNPTRKKNGFIAVLALGAKQKIEGNEGNAFSSVEGFKNKFDEIFGYFSYDLKNETEVLTSKNTDFTNFPAYFFFQPKLIVKISTSHLQLASFDEDQNYKESFKSKLQTKANLFDLYPHQVPKLNARITKQKYIDTVNQLKNHIYRGDVYEVNFCQEFFAENISINPFFIFEQMMQKSATPFASFLKNKAHYLLSASPERFLRKEGNKVFSQPIKGTAKRGENSKIDEQNKVELSESSKEKSENVMIVDLVRNDLSTFAETGSVKVDELFKIYTFPQWHQMISTISCEVNSSLSCVQILKKCFPMGSMTGAPKLRAMQLIEKHESFKRGIFSGAIGYFDANNNFDFNVVIRSIAYNAQNNYLSVAVGSAITAHCDAEKEYEECLTKAQVLFTLLEQCS